MLTSGQFLLVIVCVSYVSCVSRATSVSFPGWRNQNRPEKKNVWYPKQHQQQKRPIPFFEYDKKTVGTIRKAYRPKTKHSSGTKLRYHLEAGCCGNRMVRQQHHKPHHLAEEGAFIARRPFLDTRLYDEYQEDVKPVTERIEGDFNYDFRTKTHSYD